MRADVVVLGAGIVGISVALHLQKRGRSVVLLDRRGAAEETSYGNAGLIQREGVYPYGFPHDFGALLRYGFNRTIDAHYHPSALLDLAPFLWKYWKHSRRERHARIAKLYARLIEHCVTEHDALAAEAGAAGLLRRDGWMRVFRTERERDLRIAEAAAWRADSSKRLSRSCSVRNTRIQPLRWIRPVAPASAASASCSATQCSMSFE